MCIYWKKQYTCDHLSGAHVELCRDGRYSNTVCSEIADNDTIRKSYFPCYDCIRDSVRAEAEAATHADQQAMARAREAREQAARDRLAEEKRKKEERVRQAAKEKADREREEEAKAKAIKEQEQERAKKEGGLWVETGSGKKGKARKAVGGGGLTGSFSAPAAVSTFAARDKKENEGGAAMSPRKDGNQLNLGGRAGVWGPPPVRILTRKDNEGMKK